MNVKRVVVSQSSTSFSFQQIADDDDRSLFSFRGKQSGSVVRAGRGNRVEEVMKSRRVASTIEKKKGQNDEAVVTSVIGPQKPSRRRRRRRRLLLCVYTDGQPRRPASCCCCCCKAHYNTHGS